MGLKPKLLLYFELVLLIAVATLLLLVRTQMRKQVVEDMQREIGAIASTAALQLDGDLLKTIRPHHGDGAEAGIAPLTMDAHGWAVLAIGFVVSFIVALGVVAWFMRWVRARGFGPFALYRIVLGIVLLVLIARGSL